MSSTLLTFFQKYTKAIILLFFAAYLLLGVVWSADYGVSTDESFEANTAQITIDYVTGANDRLLTYEDRHYGALFALLLQAASSPFSDSRDNLLARHLVTFLFFYLSTILFYKLLRKLGFSSWFALLGTALLILNPQIFGHSFFNPKDTPFLSMFIVGLTTLTGFAQKPTLRTALLHGIVSGLLVVFRLPGGLMWAITAVILLWMLWAKRVSFKDALGLGAMYLLLACLSLYAFLPVLWHDPIGEITTYLSMSPITWTGSELLLGQRYELAQIPWFHLPVYFVVTTPLGYLALLGLGGVALVWKNFRSGLNERGVIVLTALVVSVGLLVVMHPRVYNGWRHIFFLYPMIVLVMMEGIAWVWTWKENVLVRYGLPALVAVELLLVAISIAQLHPYEYVYYNRLAGVPSNAPRQNYIMDYWGLSYREAFETILANDDRQRIIISVESFVPAEQNLAILPKADRERIVLQEIHVGILDDYYITNFKETVDPKPSNLKPVGEVKVGSTIINATFIPR